MYFLFLKGYFEFIFFIFLFVWIKKENLFHKIKKLFFLITKSFLSRLIIVFLN